MVMGSDAWVWVQPAISCNEDSYSDQLKLKAITMFIRQVRMTIKMILLFFTLCASCYLGYTETERKTIFGTDDLKVILRFLSLKISP